MSLSFSWLEVQAVERSWSSMVVCRCTESEERMRRADNRVEHILRAPSVALGVVHYLLQLAIWLRDCICLAVHMGRASLPDL